MKTIKLIVLCFSLLLGSCPAFAERTLSEKKAKYNEYVNKMNVIQGLIAKYEKKPNKTEKELEDLKFYKDQSYVLNMQIKTIGDSIKIQEEKEKEKEQVTENLIQHLQEEKARTTSLEPAMIKSYQKVQDGEKGWHEEMEQYVNLGPNAMQNKIYDLRKKNNELDKTISGYDAEMNNIINKLNDNVYQTTGYYPQDIDTKSIMSNQNLSKDYYSTEVSKKVELHPQEKKVVEDAYDFFKRIYINQNAKRDAIKKEYDENQKKINYLCDRCKGQCGCQ